MTDPDDSPRSTSTETQVTWGTPSVTAGPLPQAAPADARPRARVDLSEVVAALHAFAKQLGARLDALEAAVASRTDLREDYRRRTPRLSLPACMSSSACCTSARS